MEYSSFDAVLFDVDLTLLAHEQPTEEVLARTFEAASVDRFCSADGFEAAAERTLKVGDSLRKDVRTANDLGLTSVWIRNEPDSLPPGAGDPEPDHRLESLDELPGLLRTLDPRRDADSPRTADRR